MYISNPDIKQWHNQFHQANLAFEPYETVNLGSHLLEMGEYTLRRSNGDVWNRGM